MDWRLIKPVVWLGYPVHAGKSLGKTSGKKVCVCGFERLSMTELVLVASGSIAFIFYKACRSGCAAGVRSLSLYRDKPPPVGGPNERLSMDFVHDRPGPMDWLLGAHRGR